MPSDRTRIPRLSASVGAVGLLLLLVSTASAVSARTEAVEGDSPARSDDPERVVVPTDGTSLFLEPLSTPIGGAMAVDLRVDRIEMVETEGWVTTVTMRDGTEIAGRANGRLVGRETRSSTPSGRTSRGRRCA